MKAVITAGGRGTRLRPITWTINKHLIPLMNEPMLFNGIKKIAATGIKEVAIIINPGDTEIEAACGNGDRWGIRLTYIEQIGGALGLANTLWQAKDFVGNDDVLLYLGDNVILGSLDHMVHQFREEQLDCCLAFMEVDDARRFGSPILDAEGKMIGAVEKPANPTNNFAIAGLYIFKGPVYFEAYQNITPSARGEYEIPDTFDWMIKNGKKVGYRTMTGWWKDTGKPEDLLEGNQLLLNEMPIDEAIVSSDAEVSAGARIQGRVKIGASSKILGNALIRGPVVIGERVTIENCYIGPHTTIGDGSTMKNTEIEHSIVMAGAYIETSKRLLDSVIGRSARVLNEDNQLPRGHKLIIGENSYLEL